MTTLALFEFFRNTLKNILIALFLAILCLMLTVMYSIVSYEYGKFKPFKSLDIDKGYFVGSKLGGGTEMVDVRDFEGVEATYFVSSGMVFIGENSVTAYSYEKWIWKAWHARLKSGHWFTEAGAGSEELEVIIGGKNPGYSSGDTVKAQTQTGEVTLRVIGVLQDDTEIMYREGYNSFEMNYEGMYQTPEIVDEQMFILMQSESAGKKGVALHNACLWEIWKYSDDLSDKETEELTKSIASGIFNSGKAYSRFMEESSDIAAQKVTAYIPAMMVSFFLTLIALYCIASINVSDGSRYYSVYYLVGASKRQCRIIALSYTVITVFMSIIMYIILGLTLETYARAHNLMYSFVAGPKLMAAGLYIVFAAFLSVCLYLAMRKRSPLDMLRSQKR